MGRDRPSLLAPAFRVDLDAQLDPDRRAPTHPRLPGPRTLTRESRGRACAQELLKQDTSHVSSGRSPAQTRGEAHS